MQRWRRRAVISISPLAKTLNPACTVQHAREAPVVDLMPDEAEPDQSRVVCEEFSCSRDLVYRRGGGDTGATRLFTGGQIIMPNYEVTLEVDPDRVEEMEGYMRTEHIPEILRTGCFSRITFERSDSGRFRTRYEAASQEALDAYFRDHAERLRQDFQRRFARGAVPSREVWTEVERWVGTRETFAEPLGGAKNNGSIYLLKA